MCVVWTECISTYLICMYYLLWVMLKFICVSSLPTEYYDQNVKYELEQETL